MPMEPSKRLPNGREGLRERRDGLQNSRQRLKIAPKYSQTPPGCIPHRFWVESAFFKIFGFFHPKITPRAHHLSSPFACRRGWAGGLRRPPRGLLLPRRPFLRAKQIFIQGPNPHRMYQIWRRIRCECQKYTFPSTFWPPSRPPHYAPRRARVPP